MRRIVFGLCLSLCVAGPAFADQAAWVTKQQAVQAHAIIFGRKEIRNYCEPCGDTAFTAEAVKNPDVKKQDGEYWSVVNNGDELDLAYVYVEVRGVWVNLAKLVGAQVEDVSAVLPAKPLPRLNDDAHNKFLQSSPEYKAADERLNRAWKFALAVAPKRDKADLESEQKYWLGDRDQAVIRMGVDLKHHMPVPAEVLRDGAVDEVKAYTLLAQSRAVQLEEYAKNLKDGKVILSGVLTEGDAGADPYLLLDDGWTWMFLCTREDPELEALDVPLGSRLRVTGALESLIKFKCDKNLKVEVLAPPVKKADKSGEAKTEQVAVIGTLGTAPAPGGQTLTVDPGPAEYYVFNEEDKNAVDCLNKLEIGDVVEVTGTLVTPAEGLPYFDSEAPTRCERLVP
jgi:uncharacterized protein YecT (DUF1311 family)